MNKKILKVADPLKFSSEWFWTFLIFHINILNTDLILGPKQRFMGY